eukprot:Sdes_comp21823_c0_seq1m20380
MGEISAEMADAYDKKAEEHTKLLDDLEKKVYALKKISEEKETEEYEKLVAENAKLKYRKLHLEKNLKKELGKKKFSEKTPPETIKFSPRTYSAVPDSSNHMTNILSTLYQLFEVAIHNSFPGCDTTGMTVITLSQKHGDYQCNSAMAIAKKFQGHPNGAAHPREAAEKILENLPSCDLISSTEVAGPGFINIFLKKIKVASLMRNIFRNGVKPPYSTKKHRCGVDFSSPNIAKEMHCGHIRSTIIGDCLCRVFEFMGYEVDRINHIGDWGTQFGMLITHLQDKFPNYRTSTPSIGDLQTFYQESKSRFDSEEEFKKRAYGNVVALQSGNKEITACWKLICDVSIESLKKIYKRLDVRIREVGESFYQPLMPGVLKDMHAKNLIVEEDGRKLIFPKVQKTPLTVQKSDGGFGYATSDLAALNYRVNTCKYDTVVYVVDWGQSLHLESVFEVGRMAGYYDPSLTRVVHVGFGVMQAESGKKFKTREGTSVRLGDLLDEALYRSEAILKEKGRDKELTPQEFQAANEAIAYGAVKYSDLSRNRAHDYQFSFDRMLDMRGNTAVYLLYAYTRIASIARNA